MSTLWLPPPQVLLPGHDFAARPSTHLPPFASTSPELALPSFSTESFPSFGANTASARQTFDTRPTFEVESLRLPALMPGRTNGAKRIFLCPHDGCGQTFTVNGNLKKHIAAKHELRKDFKCSHKGCGRSFAKKFNMMRHLNVHRTRGDKRSTSVSPGGSNRGQHPLLALSMLVRARPENWSSDELLIASFMADHCADNSPTSSQCMV